MTKLKAILGKGDIRRASCDALCLMFVEKELSLSLVGRVADKATGGALAKAVQSGFKGKKNEIERIPAGKSSPFGQVILVGLGPRDKLDIENYRQAGGAFIGALEKRGEKLRAHVELRDPFRAGMNLEEIARAFVVGAALRSYRYLEYKTRNSGDGPVNVLALYGDSRTIVKAIDRGLLAAESQCLARDLINTPSAMLTPELFVKAARTAASEHKLQIKVWKEPELKKARMNAILAVGQGSYNPPRLVALTYTGAKRKTPDLVLVGKGVTFDSGGISIKPSAKMDEMKGDMSGAAAVLATMTAVARLKLKVNVVGVIPLAENMPGGGAQRPGDIIRTASGQTVEVKNTDAEGRLILADALHYATTLKPRVGIVDIATLTGACTIALGSQAIGLMGNNEDLLTKVGAAALASGERTWLLPLWEEYEDLIDSQVADMINTSTRREAGTIVGGIFLKRFVGDTPWVHLDIASVMWNDKAGPYLAAGPTGKGVRLFIRLLESLQ